MMRANPAETVVEDMIVTIPNIRESDPARLSRMLDFGSVECPWQPEDLRAILRHQLTAPIESDLAASDEDVRMAFDSGGLPIGRPETFNDLLHDPAPPLKLLEMLKAFAKANMLHPESALPREIATILYYSAICAALVRLGRRLSALPAASLMQGIETALDWDWVDPATRELLEDGRRRLSAPEDSA
jgi:hypothetical protein